MSPSEQAEYDRQMLIVASGYLRVVAGALTVFYLVRALSYFRVLSPDIAHSLSWPMLASCAFCGVVFLFLRKQVPSAKTVHSITLTIGMMLIFNVFWNLYLTKQNEQILSATLVIVAFGLITVNVWIWLAQLFICFIAYLWAMSFLVEGNTAQQLTLVFAGLIMSTVAFRSRAPVIKERLRLEIRMQADAEKLRMANETKDQFVANMTHELRTPLTGVMGMMDLMEDTKLDTEQKFMLTNAQKSAKYLLNIVNDILDFSKLEAGKLQLKTSPTDLISTCRDAVAVFAAQAQEKGLNINLYLPNRETLMVNTDGLRVGQVLLNFIGNAVKFTQEGQVDVTLEWTPKAVGGLAKFSISDTGVGISDIEIAKLFHRFEQVDSSATRVSTGTGLGLAICEELVKLMGGTIHVTSKLGKGSSFSFEVDLKQCDDRVSQLESEHVDVGEIITEEEALENPVAQPSTSASPARVLVAEDNSINQILIMRLLELEGLDVMLVENGQEAVDAVDQAEDPFDLIFMDIQMPVMDGLNAAKIIRLRMANPPPIIALTANTLEQDLADYKKAGIASVLGKPLSRDDLWRVLKDFLGKK